MNKKFIKIVCIVLVIVLALSILISVIATIASAATPSQSALDNLKTQQESLQQQMQDLQSQIDSMELDQTVVMAQKELLDEKVDLTQQEIDVITEQIVSYEELISEKEDEIASLEAQQEEQWELYKLRMRAMEENGTVSYYAIIFGASSFSDMLMRIDAVNSIMEYDEQVYEDLVEAQKLTEEAKSDLELTKLELEDKQNELADLEDQLIEEEEEAAELLKELEENISESEALYDEMSEERNQIQKEINEMEEELKKLKTSSVTGTGNFIWPAELQGSITSFFGWRTHPVYGTVKYHEGIDIGGLGYGANVLASDSGTVLTATYSSSYGNYVTISHGNGYTTLYAHMSKLLVSQGDTVTQGQVIGKVGSTGLSTGPHLHFEVWLNGSRVDPLNFFSNYVVSSSAY